jgi:hypothetical protein
VLALAHGWALALVPSMPLIALGLWWNSNTIAHDFLHLPFFRSCWLNRVFSCYLSALLGIPQRLWRDRHMAHHADRKWRLCFSRQLAIEALLIGLIWAGILWRAPGFFWKTYLPGWLFGLALCYIQGWFEHARGTTSHYGWLYNWAFFNDGYHVEHHAQPRAHWRSLPRLKSRQAAGSRWPAVFRWIEWLSLDNLEKLVVGSPLLQKLVLRCHERAFRRLMPEIRQARTAIIVGGGLFPRTALILQRLLPDTSLTIVDRSREHIQLARRFLGADVSFVEATYGPTFQIPGDLVVIPLSFVGNRDLLEPRKSAMILVHDWLWRRRGKSVVISLMLAKRLNLLKT